MCDKRRLWRDFLCVTNGGSGETFCVRQTKALTDFLRATNEGSGETFSVRQTKTQANLSACDKRRLRRNFQRATSEGSGETAPMRRLGADAQTRLSLCLLQTRMHYRSVYLNISHAVMFACCSVACIIGLCI